MLNKHINTDRLFFILLASLMTSCSNPQHQSENQNMAGVSDALIRTANEGSTVDSSAIAIVSPDGRLIREFKYIGSGSGDDYRNYIKGYPDSDTLTGDFNGDGKQEHVWLEADYEKCRETGDEKSCRGKIQCSDNKISPLVIDDCPFGSIKNEGDLNDDGKDEIGILPGWFTSACRGYEVYTLRNNKWKEVCNTIANTENMRQAGIILIEKDTKRKGYAIVREAIEGYINKYKNTIPAEYIQGSCCSQSNVVESSIKLK